MFRLPPALIDFERIRLICSALMFPWFNLIPVLFARLIYVKRSGGPVLSLLIATRADVFNDKLNALAAEV